MSSLKILFINQFLMGMSTLEYYLNYAKNGLYDLLDGLIIYTIKEDLINPYEKMYYTIFLPYVYVTLNSTRHTIGVTTDRKHFQNNISSDVFYTSCIIHNRSIMYGISNKPVRKISTDFSKLPFPIYSMKKKDISNILRRVVSDIQLTANHICIFMKYESGKALICYTDTMCMYVFKDFDLIK